jgi:pimeloyl-ACP methyl ester carboxylesterase
MTARTRRAARWVLGILLAIVAAVVVVAVVVWRAPLATMAFAGRATLRWSGFEKLDVAASAGRITYFRGGGAGRPVVFVHGVNDTAGSWARIAPALVGEYRVVVLDLAGHGDSEPRQGPLSMRHLVDGVAAVVDAEARGGPVTLVGNSLGGFLVLQHAIRHPEAVVHAVLVNGAVDRGDGSHAAITLLPRNRDEARKAMDALTSPGTPRMPAFVLDDLVRRAPHSPLARLMAQPSTSFEEFSLDDRLAEVTVPVTMIWGADDRLLSLEYARRAAARMPRARLEILPGCAHVPQRECPGPFLARLRESLARVPAVAPEGA